MSHRITRSSAEALARVIRNDRFSQRHKTTSRIGDSWPDLIPAEVTATSTAASFASGVTTPGEGEAKVQMLNTSGAFEDRPEEAITFYSIVFRKYIIGELIFLTQDQFGRYWVVDTTDGLLYMTPSGGIAARSGSGPYTPGAATCDRYEYYVDSGTLKFRAVSPGVSDVVYNVVPKAVTGSRIIQAKMIMGRPTVDVESCP